MITRTVRLPYKSGGCIRIKPLYDWHSGNVACDEAGIKKYLEKDDTESTYFIGGGDLMDSVITTDLKRYQKSIDTSSGDEIIDEQIAGVRRILEPYKSRIIGLGTGNHEDVIARKCGTHPMKRLCSELGVPYHGYSCLLGITIYNEANPKKCARINFRIHHGWGGGSRTAGGSITKYEKDRASWDADVFMYGHDHKCDTHPMQRLGLCGGKLAARPQMLILCGTFLKTFTDTADSTYSERAGYPPTMMGSPSIIISMDRNGAQRITTDMHDSS